MIGDYLIVYLCGAAAGGLIVFMLMIYLIRP